MKIPLLLFTVVLTLSNLTGCSINQSSILLDSDSCIESLSRSIIKIMSKDMTSDKDDPIRRLLDKDAIASISYTIKNQSNNDKIDNITISDNFIKYDFLIQKEGDKCWLRLYHTEKQDGSSEYKHTNTYGFIDSERVDGCFCSASKISPISPSLDHTFELKIH